jgi:hypothetical protein
VASWPRGEQTVRFLINRGRLENIVASDRTRHRAQYFDPSAAPITKPDAEWAIEKATAALGGVKALLSATPPGRFS